MTTINTETTFDFGAGPVPAHRHINPNGDLGGWVHDTAVVDGGAYVSGEARVYGEACVSGEACVYGEARVSITPAHLSGLTYTITITDAHIQLGCQVLDFHTFATLTRAQAYDLDGEKATAFYDAYYDILSALVSKKGT